MDNTKDESYSYVTYGMLHKNHEFVDWVRVDLGEDDKVRIQNANDNVHDGTIADNSLKDMDERAFEKFKTQWQEISASEASIAPSGSNDSLLKEVQRNSSTFKLGKKLLASASAKTLSPNSISYGVFDADWTPIKLSPRHSNVDVAILLHAASKENGKNNGTTTDSNSMRTYLTETLDTDPVTTHSDLTKSMVSDGKLPIVPVRRSSQQQFLIKQSVQLFFRKDSIQFFACFPLRYSPRTIYRFDMVNGGIDHTFWQKVKISNNEKQKKSGNAPTMNAKLIQMRSKMASNSADFRESIHEKVSTTRESILNLTNKKSLLSNNDDADADADTNVGETDVENDSAEKTTKVPAKQKLSMMRLKMANNAFSMKNSFASKVSTTKESLLQTNRHKTNPDDTTSGTTKNDVVGEAEKSKMPKLSQMKWRMSDNTSRMKFNFASKLTTTKDSVLNMNKKNNSDSSDHAQGDKTMPAKLSQMKLRMSENTNQMKQRMSQNKFSIKNSFASKVSGPKMSSFLNINKKNAKAEGKESEIKAITDTSMNALLGSEEYTFTIDDGEEEDDDIAFSSPLTALQVTSTPSAVSSPAGYVALSFDDVPCRFDDRSHSQLENVLDLLTKYDAKATFMVISSFLADCHESDMIRLLVDGHELANHGVRDEAMDKMATSVETFVEALDECNTKIKDLQKKAGVAVGVKWFRAPQAKYTKIMEEGLVQRDMHNVMCDAYAACPIVEDGPWIASALSKQIRNGSIALLHMPEKCGFREYCFEALEHLLEDLQKRDFKVVTVGELHQISEALEASKQTEELSKEEQQDKSVLAV